MGEPISLFSGYDQKENRHTNYCLLMLRLIYEESPRLFQQVVGEIDPDLGAAVGVRFRQQSKRGTRIPDGMILQPAFQVFIETKNWDWFYDAQLRDHLAELDASASGYKLLIALSNFEGSVEGRFAAVETLCAEEFAGRVRFVALTFEGFVEAIRASDLTPALTTMVDEFEEYLDRQWLLPRWRNALDVVNAAQSYDRVLQSGAYVCPAAGGQFEHRRCRYLGLYRWKTVGHLAEVEAVVDLLPKGAKVRWNNVDAAPNDLVERARRVASEHWAYVTPPRVFLLGPLSGTRFLKDSRGGLYNSKRYFYLDDGITESAETLADALRDRYWSDVR